MNQASSNGIEIMYEDRGSGETVVLLHGFCGSSAYWQKMIPQLSLTHRVIAADLRGHGKTSVPDGLYSMETMADDIAGLLSHLEISKATLFGHSLGGYVTLAFAEKYPDRLSAFSLVHSTAYPDDENGKEGRLKAIESIQEKGMDSFIEGLVPRLFAPEHVASMPEAVQLAKQIGFATSSKGAIHTLQGMRERPDRNSVLGAVDLPVLLVAGTEDQVIPPAKTFSQEGRHIHTAAIAGAGHMSMLEAPDKLIKAMEDFLRNI